MTISSMASVVIGTPAWVWLLLAFLVYRGVLASRPRRVGLWKPALLPAILMVLSVGSGSVETSPIVEAAWLPALAVGLGVGALIAARRPISVEAGPPATILLLGGWSSLGLILAIFSVRYVEGVMTAIDPATAAAIGTKVVFALLRGLFSGIFLGQGLMLVARGWSKLCDREGTSAETDSRDRRRIAARSD
ncbi:DUF6622 family protein [Pleomorphomonas sp. JP5]|uniref:DUF6622 family protein n=1 Tax=Pleomorphomonas sp. JP5 TaxID=2942998 RepID=UPI00204371C5|nr:DUF6622 family protein [Pleomorphomonas sp. JP5]MCM5557275.1 hypothetical protein [Pleomorphomonas sp. JP5]